MVTVGIVGATGYTGEELIDILLRHPQVRLSYVGSRTYKSQDVSAVFPRFKNRIYSRFSDPDPKEICAACDVVFLALPHTVSMDIAPALMKKGKRVIDLSADYRFRSAAVFEANYDAKHKDPEGLARAVYGLPELYRVKIKSAQLVANPGCYPTASILALAPLAAMELAEQDSIIIDAKSGVTGAGRKLVDGFLFSEVNEDFKAYKVNVHQHAPEISQELAKLAGKKTQVTFVPHLLPLNRGILATIYAKKTKKSVDVQSLYEKFYKNEPFIRIRPKGVFPRLKDVVNTNFCDIGIRDEGKAVIIIAAIDNLLKGASGQAVQNFNSMHGFPETTALL